MGRPTGHKKTLRLLLLKPSKGQTVVEVPDMSDLSKNQMKLNNVGQTLNRKNHELQNDTLTHIQTDRLTALFVTEAHT